MVTYESEGLFVGLISYQFNVDGAQLYQNVIRKLFDQHRSPYLASIAPPKEETYLYKPAAYRMFGSSGLAVISLIDEYAFSQRIFNSSHVKLDKGIADKYPYKCFALTGSSENFLENGKDTYLMDRALKTFLKKEARFPFIGLIRIKVEPHLLFKHGIDSTRKIKKQIEEIKDNLIKQENITKIEFESIVVDSYDADELLVVAFSNCVKGLDYFFKAIRQLTIRQDDSNIYVCTACHTSYGYDMDFFAHKDIFLPWAMENDKDDRGLFLYNVRCIAETNPGHRKAFYDKLSKSALNIYQKDCEETVTGGGGVKFELPLDRVEDLHQTLRDDTICINVRRMRLVLAAKNDFNDENTVPSVEFNDSPLIRDVAKEKILRKLTKLGISKITRERALSLIDLLNDCGGNPLQQVFFAQLQPAVAYLDSLLQGFLKPDPGHMQEATVRIEECINTEINALETAIYNRMYNRMKPNAVLEYGGGIQQLLQAFGHAFQELFCLFCPENLTDDKDEEDDDNKENRIEEEEQQNRRHDWANRQYMIITGAPKEFSVRTHTELNINHLLYPQLFCLTTWKEASNYSILFLDQIYQKENASIKTKALVHSFNAFKELLHSEKAMFELRELIMNSYQLPRTTPICQHFERLLSPSFLKYTLHDFLVYHFAFQRDFSLMWRVYWKAFLQTSSCYIQRGVIRRMDFIHLMLRLMMVASRIMTEDELNQFQKKTVPPPDPLLIPLWIECFDQLKQLSVQTCKALSAYNYLHLGETLVAHAEGTLIDKDDWLMLAEYLTDESDGLMTNNTSIPEWNLQKRKEKILRIKDRIKDRSLSFSDFIDANPATPDHIICLMSAFIQAVEDIDSTSSIPTIQVSPRDEDGNIDLDAIKELRGHSSGVLADPTGGFVVIGAENRKKYFVYRTILYRTLWDLCYRSLRA